eukprot:16853-Heterococcus_DN1.PRE.1
MMQIELDDTLRTAYTGEGSASSASSCSSDNSSPTSTAHANYSLTASSLQATAARVFKRSLIEVYSPNCCESQVHCMVLHKVLPEPTVVAARICRPRSRVTTRDYFICVMQHLAALALRSCRKAKQLSDVDDLYVVRNGLLLFKPLAKAFERGELVFLPAAFGFIAYVLNAAILDTLLIDIFKHGGNSQQYAQEIVSIAPEMATMTYRDVHLRRLQPQRSDIKLQVHTKFLQQHAALSLITMEDSKWYSKSIAEPARTTATRLQHNESISRWLADSNNDKSTAIDDSSISDDSSSVIDSDAQQSETCASVSASSTTDS